MKEFLINAGPLVAAIKTLKPFISDDENRPYLGGVFFEMDEDSDTLNLVATDGIKLCVLNVDVDRQELFDIGELKAIVPEKALDTMLAMLKGVQPECPIALTFGEERSLHIDTPDEKGDFRCIEGDFPEYRKVIPGKMPKFVIGLGKAQAQEAMKAVASQGADGLAWEMTDAHSPLVIRGEKKLVVVMPMRVTLPGEMATDAGEDKVYADAVAEVRKKNRCGEVFLSANLSISIEQAAALVQRMETEGVISAPDEGGKRHVIKSTPL